MNAYIVPIAAVRRRPLPGSRINALDLPTLGVVTTTVGPCITLFEVDALATALS